MSEINWERHKSAVYATVNFFDESDRSVGFKRLYRPATQTKTVADAYEEFPNGYDSIPYELERVKREQLVLCAKSDFVDFGYNYIKGGLYRGQEGFSSDHFYEVCTREQFEAYAKERETKQKHPPLTQSLIDEAEQEGEKWTHKFGRERCYVKVPEEDCEGFIVIVTETDGYLLCQPSELKPIKPKLTKAQAWDKLMERQTNSAEVNTLKQQYDII